MADFRAVYRGSRSILCGTIWLVLGAFCDDVCTVMDLFDMTGVESPIDGRLKAAGSMSGIFAAILATKSRASNGHSATRNQGHELHGKKALVNAIVVLRSEQMDPAGAVWKLIADVASVW